MHLHVGSKDLAAGTLGEDLAPAQQTAYLEGLDADLPNTNALAQNLQAEAKPSASLTKELELEKGSLNERSDINSVDDHVDDPEKVQPVAIVTEQDDPNTVFWDGPDDPANPMNWPSKTKWSNIIVLSCLTFLTPLASSFFAPAVPQVMQDFSSNSQTIATLVVSIYVLGFACGPLLVAPASELYGRQMVYHISNIGFLAFTVGCALAPNLSSLIVFRFLQGVWGVTPVTIGGGTIADLIPAKQRGAAMSIWVLGPLMGPVIGPVAGGFLSQAKGWRWIFWVIAMASGVMAIAAALVLRETYAPILLERKTKRLQKETGNMALRSKLDNGLTPKQLFIRAIVRPSKLMFLSPVCGLMSLYMAVIYAFLYLLFTTFTYVFEEAYHFSTSTVGLVFIGLGIGNFVGLGIMGYYSDKIVAYLAKRHGNGIRPEYRLPPLMCLGPCIPIGFFIYGWTAQEHVHWIVPLIGTMIIGIGMIAVMMCVNTYLVDAFTLYAASAIAANTVLRSLFGGLFPLFGLQMYAALGWGWGNSLLAFIGLALCPIPFLFYRYGEKIRTHPKFQIQF